MAQSRLSDLPEVFVPFETVKAQKGKIVFYNNSLESNLSEPELLSSYNYVTIDSDAEVNAAGEKKIFYAERYGGDGILTNGGGGRCGYDGTFHLKGIGANQLVGARAHDGYGNSHGNGFLSLDVAVYEAIWAEIINVALPHGAVRTAAVIDLGVDFKEPDQTHPRGLLVRVPAVRPAHFIRAVYFKERKHTDLSEDAKRVMLAVRKLVRFLPSKGEDQITSEENRLENGMIELANRYANQFAAARVKRIFHQSISASNVTLDGAWMDLAGATVFSNAMWWDGFNINRFMSEYAPAMESIQEMCFYLSKYKVVSAANSNSILEKSVATFAREYERNLYLYTAVQLGFPFSVIQEVLSEPVFIEFSKVLQKVLAYDEFSLVPVTASLSWEGCEHYVSRLYRQLLMQKFTGALQDVTWFCKDARLMAELMEAYDRIVELMLIKVKVSKASFRYFVAYMAISTTRLNRVSKLLLEVRERIINLRVNSRANGWDYSYTAQLECTLRDAGLAYSCPKSFDTILWEADGVVISFNGLSGIYTAVDSRGCETQFSKVVDLVKSVKGQDDLLTFYESVREFLP